jgi:hypothetical protein
MNGPARAEPRPMSLADMMVVVAGCAVAHTLRPFFLGWVNAGSVYGLTSFFYHSLYFTARRPLLIVAFATAAAILVRQARYTRMPRPAEWSALVMAAALLSEALIEYAYDHWLAKPLGPPDPSIVTVRWAAAWTLPALACLTVLMVLRRRIPAWARTLILIAVTAMLFCGPVHGYFKGATGAPPRDTGASATWAFQLRWAAWTDGGRWPELLVFGIPIALALCDWKKPAGGRWIWTEWAGLGLGLAHAACWWLDRISFSDAGNPARLASIVVRGLWLVAVGLVSWLIVRGCAAVGTRADA